MDGFCRGALCESEKTGAAAELFVYQFDKKVIRVWMRTAVQKRVTSFGTFLSTLCHEFTGDAALRSA
jgi:hypothetical protein